MNRKIPPSDAVAANKAPPKRQPALSAPDSRASRSREKVTEVPSRSTWASSVQGVFVSHMFRHPEPMYDDTGRHPFPSRSVIDTFPAELKDYYLKVLQHLETGCDLEPASEAVIRLHSIQQQSTVVGSTDPNICDSETKSVEGVDSKSSARSSSIPPASSFGARGPRGEP